MLSTVALATFVIVLLCQSSFAGKHAIQQNGGSQKKDSGNKVTITGCMTDGLNCYIFATSDQKHKYAIAKSDDLQLGATYKIVGTLSEAPNSCGEYLQMITAEKITDMKQKCEDRLGGVPGKPDKPAKP